MPWPWEYDPENSTGQGPVTTSDRLRMGIKFLFAVAGIVVVVSSVEDDLGHGMQLGAGIALAGAGVVDFLWMWSGDIDHTLLPNRTAARIVASLLACGGTALLVLALG